MAKRRKLERTRGLVVVGLMVVQAVSAGFFVVDLVEDLASGNESVAHRGMEIVANLTLVAAIAFEASYLARLLRRQADADRAISVASGALHDVMEAYFDDWALTPAEADVARFTIKGLAIAEVAALRGSAEATVKTHLNAIYRKAGVPGRAQLVNLLIEELLGGPIVPPDMAASRPGTAGANTA